ncbi:hypothetical protein [Aquabacterium commune]
MTVQTTERESYLHAQWFAGKKLEQGRFLSVPWKKSSLP